MLRHDRGNGVLIALHGHGDEPSSAREWGRGVAPPGWEVVAPGAARGEDGVRSWFPTGPRGVAPGDLRRAVGRVADIVERVRRSGRRVVVVGFSQGGAVALSLAAHGVAADAVVGICTFLPEVHAPDGGTGANGSGAHGSAGNGSGGNGAARVGGGTTLTGKRMLVISTEGDEDVPAFFGEDAAAHLRAEGHVAESVVLPGGHRVTEEVQRHAAAWLSGALRPGPRVSLGLPTDRVERGPELVSGAAVAELSAWYERLGFHALFVTDHPAPDDRWLAAGGHHALDPTGVLSAAAVVTSRIRLHTNVFVLPYRNPFLAAKSLATIDVLSGGRLIVGAAAGYLRPEFDALGADFEDRAARLDEALDLLPRIWSGQSVGDEGSGWRARGATSLPETVQRPHPPIWVGGNSIAAMRRAAAHAQGWCPFPTPMGVTGLRTAEIADIDALKGRMSTFREVCEEHGRAEPLTVCFVPFSLQKYLEDPGSGLAPMLEEIAELSEMGVDWVALMVPGSSRAEVRARAEELSHALALR